MKSTRPTTPKDKIRNQLAGLYMDGYKAGKRDNSFWGRISNQTVSWEEMWAEVDRTLEALNRWVR